MGWIVTNWRLKLLALLLALGLLGAVAMSKDPPTFDTVSVRVDYRNLPTDLVVTDPTTSVDVPVAGFRSDVQRYKQTSVGVTIDLSRARAGADQVFTAQPRLDLPGLSFRKTTIPIHLTIEPKVVKQLDIEVRTTKRSPGIEVVPDRTYTTCGNATIHCQVEVEGPASVVNNLEAFVDYDVPISGTGVGSSPNQPVRFEEKGVPIDLNKTPRTIPPVSWGPAVVTVLVVTRGGSQTRTVPVGYRFAGTPACGYQIGSVDLVPSVVTVSGPPDAVSRVTTVMLDTISITGLSATQRLVKPVSSGVGGVAVDPPQVTVTLNVSQAFSCTAPTPVAGVQPTPTPSPSP